MFQKDSGDVNFLSYWLLFTPFCAYHNLIISYQLAKLTWAVRSYYLKWMSDRAKITSRMHHARWSDLLIFREMLMHWASKPSPVQSTSTCIPVYFLQTPRCAGECVCAREKCAWCRPKKKQSPSKVPMCSAWVMRRQQRVLHSCAPPPLRRSDLEEFATTKRAPSISAQTQRALKWQAPRDAKFAFRYPRNKMSAARLKRGRLNFKFGLSQKESLVPFLVFEW